MNNRFFSFFILCFAFLACFSCKDSSKTISDTSFSFTDDLNRVVSVRSAKKIAVLQGSLAHAWISAGGKLSGFTEDFSNEVKEGVLGDDGESFLDGAQNLGAMMSPNAELLVSGGYDFVVLSSSLSAHKNILGTLESSGIPCAFFHLDTFADYFHVMEIFCKITKNEDAFKKNALDVKEKIDEITADKIQNEPTVLLLRASSGKISSRSSRTDATGAMLSDLGLKNIADKKKSLLEDLSLEKIIAENPDFIFVTTMGSSEKAEKYLKSVFEENPAWQSLDAVKENRFFILPRSLFHYKPCEKWGEAYLYLHNIFKEIDK